ncbi:hypothetical protein BH11PLA2_BH11PLA2_02700 [soil metagenome]
MIPDLTVSPLWYPLQIDASVDRVLFVQFTRHEYEEASFLDHRSLKPGARGTWKRWQDVCSETASLEPNCHFIFHISHVGSTLLSRLLGLHPGLFCVREPRILRDLAEAHFQLEDPCRVWSSAEFASRLKTFLSLWSRTFESGPTALIKATSFVSEMSERLLEQVPGAKALLMFVAPATFLKALLGGAISDITENAPRRRQRLVRRLQLASLPCEAQSAGELTAMSWLCEMLCLHDTAKRFPDCVLWLDFDRFLIDPEAGLRDSFQHVERPVSDEFLHRVTTHPLMHAYAKAPIYKYDPGVRNKILDQSEQKHGEEIRRGLGWLDRMAMNIPTVAAMMTAIDPVRLSKVATRH